MSSLFKTTAVFALFSAFVGTSFIKNPTVTEAPKPKASNSSKIQAVILLDVSNSMDGLIEQAKTQLWNMVSVMGKVKCDGATPQIEIALYEYGSPRNSASNGYVKQISPFTTDLDELSKKLFSLSTNGGDEYCGHVIYNSINELAWDTSSQSYKVIFIAGNEDFLQGDIQYTESCKKAKEKGIIVNTIYCGDRMQGIKEHWNLGSECGSGSFTNINQDAKIEDIPTPYDSTLMVLNGKLNNTYLTYGYSGTANFSKQAEMDQMNTTASLSAGIKRAKVKANGNVYRNSSWDLVDATTDDSTFISKVDFKTLPDSLQKKSRAEVWQIVKAKKEERSNIQKQIETLSQKRDNYILEEKKRNATQNNVQTLETETEKIIKQQAKRFNMVIE